MPRAIRKRRGSDHFSIAVIMVLFLSVMSLLLALGAVLWLKEICPFVEYTIQSAGELVITVFLIESLAVLLNKYLFKWRLSPDNKTVFVTGCDTGFGHAVAKRLDANGFHVIAGCLDPKSRGALHLESLCSSKLHVVPLDVRKEESVQNALAFVKDHLEGRDLWGIVNNAGVLQLGDLEWTSLDRIRDVFEVNTFGVVRVTQAFLPLIRRSRGRVVTITSFTVRAVSQLIGAYAMSKWASQAFCQGLRMEMKNWGVKVSTVEPFFYRTPIADKENVAKHIEASWKAAPSGVKSEYGEDYVEELKRIMYSYLQLGSYDISQVADSVEDAVTSSDPQWSYLPSPIPIKVLWWAAQFLPESILYSIITSIFRDAVPKALSKGKIG